MTLGLNPMQHPFFALLAASLLLSTPAFAQEEAAADVPEQITSAEAPSWAFENSDIPVDPDFVFGTLPNGMRYIIRENATPVGTALIRLRIGSGSLSETSSERGLAHFLEHMAFNGSANVPEGEMVKLLEREGLAFGADTNAATGFDETIYKLNLPRNDEGLLDIALMLMRETASELTIDQDAVDRERGIVLAERRDRRNYAQRELEDRFAFTSPGARYPERLPIGTEEVLQSASADDLRGYYAREYVPANTTLVVIGDFDAALVEAKIRGRFDDWLAAPKPAEARTGPVDITRSDLTDIYLDPALNERLTISRLGEWHDEPDSIATRQRNLMRRVGYGIVNRRLQRLARQKSAPFNSAGYGTGDVFEDARTTRLVVATPDGNWRRGLAATGSVWREATQYGFTQAEVDEQIANIRTSQRNAAASADTRSHGALTSRAMALVSDEVVPSTPQSSLERFEMIAPQVTPANVLAAMQADAIALDDPLIRFRGRQAPEGGEAALREAWAEVMAAEITAPGSTRTAEFAYQDFGELDDPAILLVMGLGAQLIHWDDDLVLSLVDAGYRVIRFDNRDVGLSEKLYEASTPGILTFLRFKIGMSLGAPYHLDDMAKDAIGLLDHLGIQQAHVVGASMGGMIAQIMAANYPQRVASLGSIMSTSGASHLPEGSMSIAAFDRSGTTREERIQETIQLLKNINAQRPGISDAQWYIRSARGYDRNYYADGGARQLWAIMDSGDRVQLLQSIQQPTVVIHGKQDPLIPIAHGEHTAELIGDSSLLAIESMGHFITSDDQPQIVNAIIENIQRVPN